jgi:hypothetical protein
MRWHGEPTLDEILSDPIVRKLMARDGVDPHPIRMMLHGVPCRPTVTTKLRVTVLQGIPV